MPRSGLQPEACGRQNARRFNEAGAIMPRSGALVINDVLEAEGSFNEAGAIMPRSGERAH